MPQVSDPTQIWEKVKLELTELLPPDIFESWFTDVEYVTRERQCNSAVRIHNGSGQLQNPEKYFEEASCARVVVRCQGTC